MARLENGLMQVRFIRSAGYYNANEVAAFTDKELKKINPALYSTDVEGSEDKEKTQNAQLNMEKHKARVAKKEKLLKEEQERQLEKDKALAAKEAAEAAAKKK